ncbi:TraR/DksA family transcriptional regulator [Hydrogenothermus marinus]|uniref:TraR/DksA family transcriptional regulator n=1 Tax=Hydrogenothermus marinus TaxID=133270 RepID=A0A3M0BJ32_9AQUI|nr:TraR/DksA family transcriptional regulator [Hydrogenothermus marinus]RMA97211.1 TraR/DksA family transcriptional regulator [Hydrogenothermus marinus]
MDIEKVREELLKKRAEIIESLENNKKESQNEKSGVEDAADEVTAELSRETLYKLSQTEREKLFLIDIALKKIESGTYGICEECGNPIGEKRLEAIPWVRLCIDCSQNEEALRLSNGYEDINYYNILPDASNFIEEEDNKSVSE